MTASDTRPRSRPRPKVVGGNRSWDPLIRPIAWLLLGTGLFLNSSAIEAYPGGKLPNSFPLLVALASIGLAFVLPRSESIVIPILPTTLVVLSLLSPLWSTDQANTILQVRSTLAVAAGIAAMVLVLPTLEIIAVSKWFVRVTLLITLYAVSTDATTRIHIDPTGRSPDLRGWHGYFVHKNVMAAFLLFGLAIVLQFDRSWWTKIPSLAAIAVLFVGSDSTTGRMSALVLVAVKIWFEANRRLTKRSSAAFIVSTVALVAFAGVAIGASLAAIADAAGKDLTFTGRTQIWAASWHAVLRFPVLGHGIQGLFGQTPISPETALVFREIGFIAGHPHNGLLDIGVQLGFVGVTVVLGIVVSVYRGALRIQGRSPDIAAWALCLMSAICVMSVGESVFLGSSIAVLFLMRELTLREETRKARGIVRVATRRTPKRRARAG